MLPEKLRTKIEKRKEDNSLRSLVFAPSEPSEITEDKTAYSLKVDFSSNDYLGFAKSNEIFLRAGEILKENNLKQNGSTGSRLLSGNHKIYQLAEDYIAKTHEVEAALIFNSGYDANAGFFSSVPQRGDVILYDELIHASIRDGVQMSMAKAYKFDHNDLKDLENKLERWQKKITQKDTIYVVTESVFSMDGDSPALDKMTEVCSTYDAKLVVDEAHSLGVHNLGIVQNLALGHRVFARLVTFGKAMGCHGAAILGSTELKSYLVNFARSFIYTTALAPHGVATILAAYEKLVENGRKSANASQKLTQKIHFFHQKIADFDLKTRFIISNSAIQSAIISGNNEVKLVENTLKLADFDVKAILSPTVPKGEERLRFCLHSYNTEAEITQVLKKLSDLLKSQSSLVGSMKEQ